MLFVSHDQDFVNNLATRVIELNQNGIISYDGNYDAYLEFKNSFDKPKTAIQPSHKASAGAAKATESTLSKKELFELRKKYKNLENNMNKYKVELETLLASMYNFAFGTPEYTAAQDKKTVLEQRINKSETELLNFPHADELDL